MSRWIPQKAIPPFLALFYFTTLTLAIFCTSNALSRHSHHPSPRTSHSISCLLACSNTVAQEGSNIRSSSSLILLGITLLFSIVFCSSLHRCDLNSRAPPL